MATKKPAAKKAAVVPLSKPITAGKEETAPPKELRLDGKKYKLPKTLGACADELFDMVERRKKLAREVEEVEIIEKAIKAHFIERLPKNDAKGVAGKKCRVTVSIKSTPQVEPDGWPKVYKNIVDSYNSHLKKKDGQQDGAFAMLQRRLGDAAVKEAWEAGKTVDGVTKYTYPSVSMSIN